MQQEEFLSTSTGWPKKTSPASSRLVSWKQTLWTKTRYQHVANKLSYLLGCYLVRLRYAYCQKKQSQKYWNSFISRTIPSFSSRYARRCEQSWIQICFGARNLNEEQRTITLQTKNFLRRLQIHGYLELSQNFGWKWWRLFHSKWGILDSKFSLNLVFRIVFIA